MSRLPQMKSRQLVRVLRSFGFELVRQKSSHAFFRHSVTGRTTLVPMHAREDIDRSLLYGILQEIGVSVDEFLEHL